MIIFHLVRHHFLSTRECQKYIILIYTEPKKRETFILKPCSMRSIEVLWTYSQPLSPHFSLYLSCIDIDISQRTLIHQCHSRIILSKKVTFCSSLLSNTVPLCICIYCIMLVNLRIKYCLNQKVWNPSPYRAKYHLQETRRLLCMAVCCCTWRSNPILNWTS